MEEEENNAPSVRFDNGMGKDPPGSLPSQVVVLHLKAREYLNSRNKPVRSNAIMNLDRHKKYVMPFNKQ